MEHSKTQRRPRIRTLCQSPMLTAMEGLSGSVDLPEGGEHNFIFIICTGGSFEFRSGREFYYITEGEALLIHSFGRSSELCYPSEDCGAAFMIVDRREIFFIAAQLVFDRLMNGSGVIVPLLSEAREALEGLSGSARRLGEEYAKHKCEELILLMCLAADESPAKDSRACTEAQLSLARRARLLIAEDLSKRLTIAELARALGVSETRLKGTFLRVYGQPVYAYTKALKMKKAASLLVEADMTVLEIAGELGYDNGSKFSEAFKSVFGRSPREYRNAYR